MRVVSIPAKARKTRPTLSSRSSSVSLSWAVTRVLTRSSRGSRAPVGDHVVDVPGQPLQGCLDPRQVVAQVDAEGLAEVVRPVRDLRPLLVGQPEQQAQHPGGVRLGELPHELDPTARREAVDELVRPAAWNCGRIASIARLRNAGPSSRRSRRWSSPSRLSSVSPHHWANGPSCTPFCAGHRALPCWKRRSLSTAVPCS